MTYMTQRIFKTICTTVSWRHVVIFEDIVLVGFLWLFKNK